MAKLVKPTWFYILETAKKFNGKPFTPNDIIDRVKEKAPRTKKYTILCTLYGMTPNHPSSKHYPSLLKNHTAFNT
jgi:hypothetical protein